MPVTRTGNRAEYSNTQPIGGWALAENEMQRPVGLDAAHRGYEYQDILTAILSVDVLLETTIELRANRKATSDDCFDDAAVHSADGLSERYQIKHAVSPAPLEMRFFTHGSCQLDKLVRSALADISGGWGAATRYRLITRNLAPVDDLANAFVPLQRDADPGPFARGAITHRFRLDPNAIWPLDRKASTNWAFLADVLTRTDLVWFLERFVIEVAATAASLDIDNPGVLEQILIDRIETEIGTDFPNAGRSPTDVARGLVDTARRARMGLTELTREALLQSTEIKSDFGAVPARPVVVPASEVIRANEVADLVAEIVTAQAPVILVGPPGQGKSWTMERLRDSLRDLGWITADHQCYVGDLDPDREERVLVETILGSLLARLAEEQPEVVRNQRPRFNATEEVLIGALAALRRDDPQRRVALFVDGLDHVSRVQGTSTRGLDPSALVAGRLAELPLPTGVVLVLSSQPGAHLAQLQDVGGVTLEIPMWSDSQLLQLAERMEVVVAQDARSKGALGAALEERSGGNPLYATYLCRELLRLGVSEDAAESLARFPVFDGTLSSYYAFLMDGVPEAGRWIAQLLALVRFPVTPSELSDIFPGQSSWILQALGRLSPVLVEQPSDGAIRIYHESFARYVSSSLLNDLKQVKALREEVAQWLRSLGLFSDARAYHHLLPTLESLGNGEEIRDVLTLDFAVRSVGAGFGGVAIAANFAVGIRSTINTGDWSCAARYLELMKSVREYEFNPLEETMLPFTDVMIAMIGADQAALRLLSDGRPVFPARQGLMLCAALDSAGVSVPWEQYLRSHERQVFSDNTSYGRESDQKVAAALLQGDLRLAVNEDTNGDLRNRLDRLAEWIAESDVPTNDVFRIVYDVLGTELTAIVLDLLPAAVQGDYFLALAGILHERQSALNDLDCGAWATRALEIGVSPGQLWRARRLGAQISAVDAATVRAATGPAPVLRTVRVRRS